MEEALLQASRLVLVTIAIVGSASVVRAAARRNSRMAWLPAGAVILVLAGSAAAGWFASGSETLAARIGVVSWFVGFPALAATFPDGRFVPAWARWPVLASALIVLGNFLAGDSWRSGRWWPLLAIAQLGMAGFIVRRYRHSATTSEREAVRWVLLGLLVTVGCYLLIMLTEGGVGGGGALSQALANAALIPLELGLVIGFARPRMFPVDPLLRAALMLGLAAALLGTVYASVTWLALAAGAPPATVAGWGTVAVAVAGYPAVWWGGRAADWVVHRNRLAPAAAVALLGERLASDDGREVGRRVVEVAERATGSPEVWLEATSEADADVFSTQNRRNGPGAPPGSFPIALHGELLAWLVARPRPGESELSARDRETLAAIAQHAAPALHGARAFGEAARAQRALVQAREEERRQLRRDLHDDLGPALSGLALGAAAIARRASEPEVSAAATELQADIAATVERARQISHGLRPTVLDEQGLEAALRDRVGDDVHLRIGPMGTLPAAVDLAVLRIVQESVTNVRRHAKASTCTVTVRRDADGLSVEVIDDGIGIPDAVPAGLGLRSIRERSDELGGRSSIARAPAGGTIVNVWLPLVTEAAT